MANYSALDAYGSVLTVASSTISGVQYPVFKFADAITVNPSSVSGTAGASIIGTAPVTQVTNPWVITGSVQGVANQSVSGTINIAGNPSISGTVNIEVMPGSVVAFQGTIPWAISSVYGNISGSVATIQTGTVIVSVVGNYAAASSLIASAPGNFNLGSRNDSLSSILGGDKTFAPMTIGPVGEVLTANAPITQWVQGIASCFTGIIQPVIAAQGSSVFTYITSGQVANASANNVYLTLYGATSSVVGFLPVPANSGALPFMPNAWKTNANGAFSASVSGAASVFLSFQGFISKT